MLDKVSDFSRKLVPIFLATILGLVLVDVVGFKLDDEGFFPITNGYNGFNPFSIRVPNGVDVGVDIPTSFYHMFGSTLDVNVIRFPR